MPAIGAAIQEQSNYFNLLLQISVKTCLAEKEKHLNEQFSVCAICVQTSPLKERSRLGFFSYIDKVYFPHTPTVFSFLFPTKYLISAA